MDVRDIPYKKPFELGFFVYSGSPRIGAIFEPYLSGDRGIETMVTNHLKSSYGTGLRFVLVEFYLFGPIDKLEHFPKRKISRFAAKQMAIRTNIPVLPADFQDRTPAERAGFVADALTFSVEGVARRLKERFPKFDFNALASDVRSRIPSYLREWQ